LKINQNTSLAKKNFPTLVITIHKKN